MPRKHNPDPFAAELTDWEGIVDGDEQVTVPRDQLREALSCVYMAGSRNSWPPDLDEYDITDPKLLSALEAWMAWIES